MKKYLVIYFFFTSLFLIAEDILPFNGKEFGLDETRKGFLDFFLINEDGEKLSLLDNGIYLNSRIYIKDGDRRFYLRDHGKYSISLVRDSLNIKWRVENIDVIEIYNKTENGFSYSIEAKNRTDVDRNIGLYIMYDTYLGEETRDHFILENYKIIKREQLYSGFEIPSSIKSLDLLGRGIEFRVMDGKVYSPDQLILGNWDQLAYSKKWPYKPKDGGMFSNGYYSINDSGIGIVYSGVNVGPKETISYSYTINFIKVDSSVISELDPDEKEVPKNKWSIVGEETESIVDSDGVIEIVDGTESIVESSEVTTIVDDTDVLVTSDKVTDLFDEKEAIAESSEVSEIVDETESIVESVEVTEIVDEREAIVESVENTVIDDETEVIIESVDVTEIDDTTTAEPDVLNEISDETVLTDKEELMRMLEYIQKKKRGEDVSEYEFDENYILEKLKERNE